jgi:ankyrin repeat protein
VNVKNKGGCTPLHEAAINNSRETAVLLLDRNASVNAKDKNGWTPLHWYSEITTYMFLYLASVLI